MKKLFAVFVVSWVTGQQAVNCVGKEPPDVVCVKIMGTQETYSTLKEAQAVAEMLGKMKYTNITVSEKKEEKKK